MVAFESFTAAYSMVVNACDSMSNLVGLENRRIFLENSVTFDQKYRMFEEIGKGRFGAVYRAVVKPNGYSVAVKLTNRLLIGQASEEMVLQERKILLQLNHPNIVQCLDFFVEPSTYFCVLEYCPGGDLFARLAEKHTFNEKNARDIFEALLNAINYCHDRNIVHRYFHFFLNIILRCLESLYLIVVVLDII